MAKKEWDFECPQFVDFERELDSSGKDDVFFESTFYEEEIRYGHPERKITWRRHAGEWRYAGEINIKVDAKDRSKGSLCTPEVQGKEKGLTESDENRLLGKMTAALSLLENTPKLIKSASRKKLYPDSVFKITKKKRPTMKPNTVPAPRPRPRRSKSLDHLNKIDKANKKNKCGLRKSSSLNDLKTNNKLKYPITPMCLKRTIFKAKEKVLKTTEEMELEQIAKLQKQLILHLRQNEISLKKLNLRPRQHSTLKPKPDNLKDIKATSTLKEKSNAAEEEPRRNIRMLSQAAVKKEALKLDTIINHDNILNEKTDNAVSSKRSKAHSVPVVKTDVNIQVPNHASVIRKTSKLDTTVNHEDASSRNTIYSRKTKTLSVSSDVSGVISNTAQKSKKLVHKKILDHSGVMFIPSWKSTSIVKPFIFEEKNKEKPQTASAKQKEKSSLNLGENNDKENKSCIKAQLSSKKSLGTQNAKCDINKLDEIAGKRAAIPFRGVPLAENVARN